MKALIIGVGMAGCIIADFLSKGLESEEIDYLVVDNDEESLKSISIQKKLLIRSGKTGGDPSIGRKAIEENKEALSNELTGYQSVIVVFGGGGGMGTGAGSAVARMAKERGLNTMVFLTKPFEFEADARAAKTASCVEELAANCIPVIAVDNENLLSQEDKKRPINAAFDIINEKVLAYLNRAHEVCEGGDMVDMITRDPLLTRG